MHLAGEIGAIFASPEKSADKISGRFYFPFVKSTATQKCINTGGILYEKYLQYRKKLIQCQIIGTKDCLPHGRKNIGIIFFIH